MSNTLIAFIRGINVGRANRVAMQDLRSLIEELGYRDVRTVLNSGNVVFTGVEGETSGVAARIEAALAARLGVPARVTVLTAAEFNTIVGGNPLTKSASDDSRLLVAFLAHTADSERLRPLAEQDWTPESLGLGDRAAYLWCAEGILASRLAKAVGRVLGDSVTTRNWATVKRIHSLIS